MKFSRFNVIIRDDIENRILLNNSLTGSTFEIDPNIAVAVEENNIELISEQDILILKSHGMIADDSKYDLEIKNVEYFHNKEKYSNEVLNITLLLTMNCNLRCIYCYEGAGIVSSKALSNNDYKIIYKFIVKQLQLRNSKTLSICLFGGEPTIELKNSRLFLKEIRNYCSENDINFITSIVTNGTLIDDDVIEILYENNCQFEQITLDGTKEYHDTRRINVNGKGSYDETIIGIKKLVESKLPNPIIRINIDKTNYENTIELLNNLNEEGLNSCNLDIGVIKSNTPSCRDFEDKCITDNELPEIISKIWNVAKELGFFIHNTPIQKFMFCGMYSDSAFTINSNLDLYKCWDLVNQHKHRIGNIGEDGDFINITDSFFNWMNRSPINIKECVECKYLPACGGGCAAVSQLEDNSYEEPGCYKIKGIYELEVLNRFKKDA